MKKIQTDNIIFVCDRAYCAYNLFNIIHDKNAKFVIRIKNNSKYINKDIDILTTNVKKSK